MTMVSPSDSCSSPKRKPNFRFGEGAVFFSPTNLSNSFEELANIAIAKLCEGPRPLHTVCGPLTTGGTGNQDYNFQVFNAVIRGLERAGNVLFNQVPYEYGLRCLAHKWEKEGNDGYCMPILEIFYARVFAAKIITTAWFIPGWRSSFGAQWEREKLVEEGCVVHDLTHKQIRTFLHQEYQSDHAAIIMNLLAE